MNIYKYELLKCIKNKFLIAVYIILLIFSGSFFYFDCKSQTVDDVQYKNIHQTIDTIPLKKAKLYIQDLSDIYAFYEECYLTQVETTLDKYTKIKGESWVKHRLSEFKSIDVMSIHRNQETLNRVMDEINNNLNYSKYRIHMQNQANTDQEISIFHDDEHIELNKKVLQAYDSINKNIALELTPTLGVERLLSYNIPNILCMILILYIAGIMIYQERKRGFTSFTETMVKGRKPQYFAKLCTICTIGIIWTLTTFILCSLIAFALYSMPSWHIAIQAIPLFMKSVIHGNIAVLLMLSALFRITVILLFSTLCFLLAQRIHSYVVFLFILLGLFGISYYAYIQITDLSMFQPLKYMNLYAFLQLPVFLGNYICFVIFQTPFSINQGLIMMIVLIFCAIIICSNLKTIKLKNKTNRKFINVPLKPHSLLYYELKKLWIKDFGIVIFIFLIMIQGFYLLNTKSNITMEDFYYNHYIDVIGNKISKKSDKKIREVEIQYKKIMQKQSDTIDFKDVDMWNRYPAFIKYKRNYENLKKQKSNILLKENEYILLFDDNIIHRFTYILMILGMLLIVSSCIYRENESKMDRLQKMSVHGRSTLWKYKIMVLMSFAIPLCIIMYSFIFVRNQQFYPNVQYGYSLENLTMFSNMGITVNILQFLVIMMIIRLVFCSVFVIAFSYVAKLIENRYAFIFSVLCLCFIGFLLQQLSKLTIFNPMYCLLQPSLFTSISQMSIMLLAIVIIAAFSFQKGKIK